MVLKDKIIVKAGKAFDKVRAKLDSGATLEFLKLDDLTNDFESVSVIESGWFIEYKDYRSQFQLQIATLDAGFQTIAESATNIKVSDEIYWIDKGETIAPILASPFWTFFCEKGLTGTGYRRFR